MEPLERDFWAGYLTTDDRIEEFLKELETYWKNNKTQRFGQLIENFKKRKHIGNLFNVYDEHFCEMLNRYNNQYEEKQNLD